MAHPDDVWVEVTAMGDATPRFLLAVDGVKAAIENAKAEYVVDRLSIEEFEARVAAALRGESSSPFTTPLMELRA